MFEPYCLKWGVLEPNPPNAVTFQNNLQGLENRLLSIKEGKIAKVERKKLKILCLNND
jgi:hypothetical protein